MKYQRIDKEYYDYLKEKDQFKKEFNWLIKGMKYGFIAIFFIILIVYSLSGNIALAQPSNVNYTWQENDLFNASLEGEQATINREYPKSFDGNYNATYTFTNEIDGTSGTDIDFITIDSTTGNCLVSISNFSNHDKVLNFTDNSGSDRVNIMADVETPMAFGTYEFWIYSTDTSKDFDIREYDNTTGTIGAVIGFQGGYLKYYSSASWHTIVAISSNNWIHLSIDFENGGGGYKGLSSDTFKIRVNGVSYGAYPFYQGVDYFRRFYSYGNNAHSGYTVYIDAIGFSWDTFYNIGDNLVSNLTVLSYNIPLEYTIDSGTVQNNINNVYFLDDNEWEIKSQEIVTDTWAIDFELDIFRYPIFNISQIKVSYDIRMDITTGDDLYFTVEGTEYQNSTTGLRLFGYNESIYNLQNNSLESIMSVSIIQYEQNTQFTMYIDLLRFEYVPLVDKMEFAFNETGSLNLIGDDNVNNWTDIENDYFNPDVVNLYYSDDVIDRSIRVYGYVDEWCGIERTFSYNYGTFNNVSWQFDLNNYGKGGHNDMVIDIQIYSYDLTEIFYIRLDGAYALRGEVYYYDGVDYVYLQEQLPSQNIDFSVFWINGFDYNATFKIDDNEYSIPSLDYSKTGIGKIRIRASVLSDYVVSGKLDLEIDNVGIYIDGFTKSNDGYSTQDFYYLGVDNWDFSNHNFMEFTFDTTYQNNVSIFINGVYEIITYGETFGLSIYWKNIYDDVNYPYPYFEIFNSTDSDFGTINLRIYGISLVEGSNVYYPDFSYNQVNIQESFFYVENDLLKYSLETDDVVLEYIQLDVNINDIYAKNRSFSINHIIDNPSLFAEVKVIYTDDTFSYYESVTSLMYVNAILPQEKIVDTFQFLITDNDNEYDGVITGYFSDIVLIYYPNIETILPMLDFLAIIPLLVIILIIPIFIYIRFKKTWLFLPTVLIFAIIGTGTGVVPLWLTVVIGFSIVAFYIISRKVNA